MNVAYIRVSTSEQNLERQKEALEKYKIDKWFQEKVSAKDINRPELQELLRWVREGDTIIVHDFSRLARSTKDLLELVEQFQAKGVNLISNKENLDTSTPQGKMMLTVIGAINTFEREILLERQREGIAIAKREGKYKNKNKIEAPENWEEIYNKYKTREITGREAMKILDLKANTFYRLRNEYERME